MSTVVIPLTPVVVEMDFFGELEDVWKPSLRQLPPKKEHNRSPNIKIMKSAYQQVVMSPL